MAQWTIYHNPQCSKSREALRILRDKGIEPKVVEYLKHAPTEAELRDLINILEDPPSAMVRVKEDLYKELNFNLKSNEEIVRHLAAHPRLLERPIVVKNDVAIIARPPEAVERLF